MKPNPETQVLLHIIWSFTQGFGKSDKYTDPSHYTHELHCMMLRKLLDHLQLRQITLVCQDW